jgi:hypothetical protein
MESTGGNMKVALDIKELDEAVALLLSCFTIVLLYITTRQPLRISKRISAITPR